MSSGYSTYFKEYCSKSSIHGFRYFGENRSIFEKVLWIVFFTVCLCCCLFAIHVIYAKWHSSPVIVNFANKGMPIHEIPFPAVTVCSESKIKASLMDHLPEIAARAYYGEPLNRTEESYFNYLISICNLHGDYENISDVSSYEEMHETMEEISPSFQIDGCYIWGVMQPCPKLFKPIITDEGICFTFNLFDRDEMFTKSVVHWRDYHVMGANSSWESEHGYSKTAGITAYPRRALLSGIRNSFKFDLKIPKEDVDTFCRESVVGFRMSVHSPSRVPRMSEQFMIVPYGQRILGVIRPSAIATSATVRKYPPKKRLCYFPREQKLGFFREYSVRNCAFECLTNVTLKLCQCVEFYMPKTKNTQICGAKDFRCVKIAENMFQLFRLYKSVKPTTTDRNNYERLTEKIGKVMERCDCLPLCSDIEYQVEMSQSPWAETYDPFMNNSTGVYLTSVSLYFASSHFIGSERNELYGPIDFLANFGGILGFFTGFSVLSLMEIIYFLSVRIICNLRLYKHWSGPEVKDPKNEQNVT